jgi:hypothetical protein
LHIKIKAKLFFIIRYHFTCTKCFYYFFTRTLEWEKNLHNHKVQILKYVEKVFLSFIEKLNEQFSSFCSWPILKKIYIILAVFQLKNKIMYFFQDFVLFMDLPWLVLVLMSTMNLMSTICHFLYLFLILLAIFLRIYPNKIIL